MLSLNQLEVLVHVVEAGGFSGAAKRLYMSQPSVSNHVRNLESSLGVQLVQRTSQGARPTPAGERAVEHARSIFAQLALLEQDMAEHQGLGSGRLVVAGTTTLGSHLLPRLVADFARTAPNVECQIRVGNEDAVEQWVLAGDVALGICAGEPGAEQLSAEALLGEAMVLVGPPSSALTGRTLHPQDIAEERFLMREMGSATRRQQEAALQRWGLDMARQWDLWGNETIKQAVASGLGVALLSEHVTAPEVAAGTLTRLSVEPAPPGRTVSLVRRTDRVLTPPEQAFAGLLRSLSAWPS